MDSKELYNATAHLNSTICWDKDWIHFGTGDEIKLDLISLVINDFLMDDIINFVYKRQNSDSHKKSEIINMIRELLGNDDFQLWNFKLDKAIKFNKIGVLQLGKNKKNAL